MAAMPPPTLKGGSITVTDNHPDTVPLETPTNTATDFDASMPCVKNMKLLEQEIRERVSGKFNTGNRKGNEFAELVERIVHQSLNNNTTKLYDYF